MAYCQPMMMAQPVMCNCAPSYGCGQYGCYRLRARASKNYRPSFGSRRESFHVRQSPFEQQSEEISAFGAPEEFRGQNRLPSGRSAPMAELDERWQKALAMASPTAAELPEKAHAYRDPNEAFLECCMDRQLPDACLSKCNFNYYNRQTVRNCFYFLNTIKLRKELLALLLM
ncbi:unnamed protein product [Gongylonema pulchrum]|uniref:DB domain-containing protein n=1 Tax=Gongylonema pulchrum TaxID=637853 RepID=A0A183DQQ1_9BILA|nr:unnamed protein product [Gongylonema pulchrum]